MSSFLNEHAAPATEVSAVQAVKEAFGSLRGGGAYTVKLALILGLIIAVIGIMEDVFSLPSAGAGIAIALIQAIFIFQWHRYCLLQEQDNVFRGKDPMLNKFLGMSVKLYLLLFVVIVVLVGLMYFAHAAGSYSASIPVGISLSLVTILLLSRIALIFPATAVGCGDQTWKDMLKLSAGKGFSLLWGYLATAFVAFVLFALLAIVFAAIEVGVTGIDETTLHIITAVIYGPVSAIMILLWAGLNSSYYRQLGGTIPVVSGEGTGGR